MWRRIMKHNSHCGLSQLICIHACKAHYFSSVLCITYSTIRFLPLFYLFCEGVTLRLPNTLYLFLSLWLRWTHPNTRRCLKTRESKKLIGGVKPKNYHFVLHSACYLSVLLYVTYHCVINCSEKLMAWYEDCDKMLVIFCLVL